MFFRFTEKMGLLVPGKKFEPLSIAAFSSMMLLLGIHVFLLIWFKGPQIADSDAYISLAQNCIAENTFYPAESNINDSYIFAPGFVNYLIILFHITQNIKIVFIFNSLLLFMLLLSLRYIIQKLSNDRRAADILTILFCLMPTFWGEVVLVRTEIPYIALAFGAFAFLVTDKKGLSVVAGILLALANWIRPLALAYLLGMIVYLLIRKSMKRMYVFLLGGFLSAIMCIGVVTYFHFGFFEYQSTTAGVNLIMGANDDADGSFNSTCFEKGKIAYVHEETLRNMTYKEKNALYTHLALEWILKNPLKWISLFPKKIFYLYGVTDLSFNYVFVPSVTESIQQGDGSLRAYIVDHWFHGKREFGDYLLIYGQLVYMGLAFGFFCACIRFLKTKNYAPLLPLFIIFFVGSAMTLMTVGGSRYHIPYLPVFIAFTAFMLSDVCRRAVPDNEGSTAIIPASRHRSNESV
jgi:hypothetical protein